MFLRSKPFIHMVDEATHYTAAAFLPSQSTADIWKILRELRMQTYAGPPDYLVVDQGTNYTSEEMKRKAEATGITMKEAPVESEGTIGVVECYHAPLKAAFERIKTYHGNKMSDKACLKMSIYAVNATVGPDGFCPMFLVYGTVLRPAVTTPCPIQLTRIQTIDNAMKAVRKQQAKSRLTFALRHPLGPKGKKASSRLRNLPAGAPVLVYRTHERKWTGPHKYTNLEGGTVVVQLPHGRSIFRSTNVKPWVNSQLDPFVRLHPGPSPDLDKYGHETPDRDEEDDAMAHDAGTDNKFIVEGETAPRKLTGKYDRQQFKTSEGESYAA